MTYPAYFYYSLTQSQIHYQKQPSGRLAVNRLLQNYEDYWISPKGKPKLLPKKLVLTPTNLLRYARTHELIRRLMVDGFDIHIPILEGHNEGDSSLNNNRFRSLNLETWDIFCEHYRTSSDFTKIKLETVLLKDDQILVLSDYEIQSLSHPGLPYPIAPTLYTSIATELSPAELATYETLDELQIIDDLLFDAGSLDHHFPKAKYQQKILILNKFLHTQNEFLAILQKNVETLEVLALSQTPNQEIKEKIKNLTNLISIHCNNCELGDIEDWIPSSIVSLQLGKVTLSKNSLTALLARLPNLRYLTLQHIHVFPNQGSCSSLNLPHLIELKIDYQFLDFLPYCPKLLYLALETEGLGNYRPIDDYNAATPLPSLKELTIAKNILNESQQNLNAHYLSLLNSSPELNNISWLNSSMLTALRLSYLNITELKIIIVDQIDCHLIKSIKNHFPKLTSLTLVGNNDQVLKVQNDSLIHFQSLHLKALRFKSFIINFHDIQNIFDSLQYLQQITFYCITFIEMQQPLIPSYFPRLTKLVMNECDSNKPDDIMDLLIYFSHNAPLLNSIKMQFLNYEQPLTVSDHRKLDFKPNLAVKHFDFDNDFSVTTISFLLNFFPKLAEFNIAYVSEEQEELSLHNGQLDCLNDFILHGENNNSIEYLKFTNTLFNAAPNLTQESKKGLLEQLLPSCVLIRISDPTQSDLREITKQIEEEYAVILFNNELFYVDSTKEVTKIQITEDNYDNCELLKNDIGIERRQVVNINTFMLIDSLTHFANLSKKNEQTSPVFFCKYKAEQTMDADTTFDENKSHSVLRIFSPLYGEETINVSDYRMNVFDTVKPSTNRPCSIRKAFKLTHSTSDTQHPVDMIKATTLENVPNLDQVLSTSMQADLLNSITKRAEEDDPIKILFGTTKVELEKDGYYSNSNIIDYLKKSGKLVKAEFTLAQGTGSHLLPSLSPNEQLLCYDTNSEVTLTFNYSSRDNLYYVEKPDAVTKIKYYLFVPHNIQPALNSDINKLVKHLRSFNKNALCIDEQKSYTSKDFLRLLFTQKTGSCRHRTIIFQRLMLTKYSSIPSRIVLNQCHAYIEIKQDNYWYRIDLGGYPGQINIIEPKSDDKNKRTFSQAFSDIEPQHNSIIKRSFSQTCSELVQDTVWSEPLELKAAFGSRLETWKTPEKKYLSITEYTTHCLDHPAPLRLIQSNNLDEIKALRYGLQHHLANLGHPLFYVHTANDLRCALPSFILENGFGKRMDGPSGPLYEFITQNDIGFLIINYSAFSSEEYVQFNALLDDTRRVDGVPIPNGITIIGLRLETHSHGRPGHEFYSRFDVIESSPLSTYENPVNFDIQEAAAPQHHSINLFKSPNWESMLLGQWVPEDNQWVYKSGQLLIALEQNKIEINIENGLWDDDNFCHFWQQAALQGYVRIANKKITFKNIKLSCSNGYADNLFSFPVLPLPYTPENLRILSPELYESFFYQYEINSLNQLIRTPGWVEQAALTTHVLQALLIASLSLDEWAKLITHITSHQIQLNLAIAPLVECPEFLLQQQVSKDYKITLNNTRLIQTTDLDITTNFLEELTQPQNCIIDISECHANELLDSIDAHYCESERQFHFSYLKSSIICQLEKGMTVILKGTFSETLASELAKFVMQDHKNLYLLSEDLSAFSFIETTLSDVDKKAYLIKKLGLNSWPEWLSPYLETESSTKLITRFTYHQRTNDSHTDNAWQGMLSLDLGAKTPDIDDYDNDTTSQTFMHIRQKRVMDLLNTQPYIYIAGLSGVGKSTLIQKELTQQNHRLYIGERNFLEWLKDSSSEYKILFIDEANLTHSNWTIFEGLFLLSPAIFYRREYYSLSKTHKVIFAGNPLSYGDERIFASLFQRHGNSIVFEPLPGTIIYQKILKPVLPKELDLETQKRMSQALLHLYQFISQYSKDELLMSPRELQMLALLTCYSATYYPEQDILQILSYHTCYMMKNVLNSDQFIHFNHAFSYYTPPVLNVAPPLMDDYTLTPSHQHVHFMLSGLLHLRKMRRVSSNLNEEQQYGGLGGLLLEGEPGIGKTKLVGLVLQQQGIACLNLNETRPIEGYYHFPVSLSLEEKEKILIRAFDYGQIVVIDEFNSSPLMERLLNSLLMGFTPEGKRPTFPGFAIIATQNPDHMPGRRVLSSALKRRLIVLKMPTYSSKELQDILKNYGMTTTEAMALSTTFHDKLNYAKKNHLTPEPCVRDVFKIAREHIKSARTVSNENYHLNKRPKLDNYSFGLFAANTQQTLEPNNQGMEMKLC